MSEATIQPRDFSGRKLKKIREQLKAETKGKKGSQSWLAYTIGAHVTSISDWERGANSPSPRHLDSIARALGVDMGELMGEKSEDDEEADRVRLLDAAHELEVAGKYDLADFLRLQARDAKPAVKEFA